MLVIDNNKIKLTRGDTAYIDIAVEGYELTHEDKLYFSLKEKIEDKDYKIQKIFNGDEVLVLMPEDTKQLEVNRYFYDIQLTTPAGEIFTIITPSSFYITEEITYE